MSQELSRSLSKCREILVEWCSVRHQQPLESVTTCSPYLLSDLTDVDYSLQADPSESENIAPRSSTTTKISSMAIESPASSSRPSSSRNRPSLSNPGTAAEAEVNPWLALADQPDANKVSRKNNKASFGKDSLSAAEKVAGKAARVRSKQTDARQADRDDAEVELDLSAGLVSSGSKKKQSKAPQVGGAVARPAEAMEDDDSDFQSDGEIEAQRGRGPTAFKQRELVKEAFANDDVVAVRSHHFVTIVNTSLTSHSHPFVQDFEEEKRKEIERDAPKEEDNTLPGWVSDLVSSLSLYSVY